MATSTWFVSSIGALSPVEDKPKRKIKRKISPVEAYRLGRMVAPKRSHNFYYDGKQTACAKGALAIGFGLVRIGEAERGIADFVTQLRSLMPERIQTPCNHVGWNNLNIVDMIEHLHDEHPRTYGKDDRLVNLLEEVYG